MLVKTRLQDLSSNLTNWFRSKIFEKKTMEETPIQRAQDDFLAERPASWYYGPLIFPEISEERPQKNKSNEVTKRVKKRKQKK